MGLITKFSDTLLNLALGLGTKDALSNSRYTIKDLTRDELEKVYRGDWVAKKVVNCPAEDATREWRAWQAEEGSKAKIEDTEKQLNIQEKTKQALIKARLYGGGALVMGVNQGTVDQPLNYDTLTQGCLKFVHVMHQFELTGSVKIRDINSPWFGRPEYYTININATGFAGKGGLSSLGSRVQIHPSRVIEFVGNPLPDERLTAGGTIWGDSVLQAVDDIVRSCGLITQATAGMVGDAKMDVVNVPNLSAKLSDKEESAALMTRFAIANQMKSSFNLLLLGDNEQWQRIETNLSALPELIRVYLMIASGAADIPASRMLGQAPRGLGGATTAGGEVDIRNYYDRISTEQETVIAPRMAPLDEVLVISATGKRDDSIFYNWRPLWQMDDAQKADIAQKKATTTQLYLSTGLFNEDLMRSVVIEQLEEDEVYPGMKDAVEEFGAEPPEPDGQFDPMTGKPLPGTPAANAQPKPPDPNNPDPNNPPDPNADPTKDAFDPDEARDKEGKWTAAGGIQSQHPTHPLPNTGDNMAAAVYDHPTHGMGKVFKRADGTYSLETDKFQSIKQNAEKMRSYLKEKGFTYAGFEHRARDAK